MPLLREQGVLGDGGPDEGENKCEAHGEGDSGASPASKPKQR
jgi:hypothetical protein